MGKVMGLTAIKKNATVNSLLTVVTYYDMKGTVLATFKGMFCGTEYSQAAVQPSAPASHRTLGLIKLKLCPGCYYQLQSV